MLPGLVGFSPGLVGFLLFTWPGGLLIELIALHPAWHWRRSALHATRPSLNTQTAAYYLYFYPRWRNFRRIWGRIFSRSGEIFSGFGAEFSADLAKISAGPGRFSSPLACVVAAYVVEFSPLLSGFCAADVCFSPVSPVFWGALAQSLTGIPMRWLRKQPRSREVRRQGAPRTTRCSPAPPRRPTSDVFSSILDGVFKPISHKKHFAEWPTGRPARKNRFAYAESPAKQRRDRDLPDTAHNPNELQRGGKPKRDNFLAILHILDARGHNSTKAT